MVLHFWATSEIVSLVGLLSAVAKSMFACRISFADVFPVVVIFISFVCSSSVRLTLYINFGMMCPLRHIIAPKRYLYNFKI